MYKDSYDEKSLHWDEQKCWFYYSLIISLLLVLILLLIVSLISLVLFIK